jgi:diaminopimelate epimerase
LDFEFFKYHGTGNDFILIDNRNLTFPADQAVIEKLCDRRFGIGADGLILLQAHNKYDFDMRYFNSDGREASMCGNGGRCVVAFAAKLGLIKNETSFHAYDGLHQACITNNLIELSMSDVISVSKNDDIYILDTGSPQAVLFVSDLNKIDVQNIGSRIRNDKKISQKGVNVNFVEIVSPASINIRTYERGVEAETWSCGTGSVASAIVSYLKNKINSVTFISEVNVRGGQLKVSFEKSGNNTFTNIMLTGLATLVYSGKITLP